MRSVPGATAFTRRYVPLRAVHAPGYRWSARYLLGRASPAWYEELFRDGARRGLRCGEITPAYFMLSADGIRRFATLLPAVRAFLLLRNPVDWAWSGLCKDIRAAGRDPLRLSTDELIARCPCRRATAARTSVRTCVAWQENFPREQLMIGFYDEIHREPVAFLERLCTFIGAGSLPAQVRELAGSRVNSSARGTPMPTAVARYAAQRFHAEAQTLAGLVEGPARLWLAQIEALLASD